MKYFYGERELLNEKNNKTMNVKEIIVLYSHTEFN